MGSLMEFTAEPGELIYRSIDGGTKHVLGSLWAEQLGKQNAFLTNDLDLFNIRALMLRSLTAIEDELDNRNLLSRLT